MRSKRKKITHYKCNLYFIRFIGSFKILKNGMGVLLFSKALEFKTLNILSLNFVASNDLLVRKSIIFRYNSMKAKLTLIERKINDLVSILKEKNPILLNYLQKNLNLVPKYS